MNIVEYEWIQHEREATRKTMAGVTLAGVISIVLWSLVLCLISGCQQDAMASYSGKQMTKDFEGFSADIYVCPGGAQTIGYGFNLSDPTVAAMISPEVRRGEREITKAEADGIFEILYERAVNDAEAIVGIEVFISLAKNQRDILIDMAYQLGRTRLSTFKDFKEALVNGDVQKAVEEMKDSKWYGQSGRRSRHHVETFGGEL